MATKTKIIQIPLGEKLLERLDEVSREREQSRAAFIREACERLLKQLQEERWDREYEEAYRRMPETEEEHAWARLGEQHLAEQLAEDSW